MPCGQLFQQCHDGKLREHRYEPVIVEQEGTGKLYLR